MKTNWRTLLAIPALLIPTLPAAVADAVTGGKMIRQIKWSEVPLPKGTTLSQDGAAVVAEHGEARPVQFSLLTLDKPGIHTKAYALRCLVRHTGVEGTGYLETWNSFPADEEDKPDVRAFSRTLAGVGPMSGIKGDSDWRPAMLPFNAEGTKDDLKKLEFNLFLPGKGKVEIKDVILVEFSDAKSMGQSLERAAEATLAPPAVPVPLAPERSDSVMGMSGSMSKALGSVFGVAVIAFILYGWRKRREAERRRMKALDAM